MSLFSDFSLVAAGDALFFFFVERFDGVCADAAPP